MSEKEIQEYADAAVVYYQRLAMRVAPEVAERLAAVWLREQMRLAEHFGPLMVPRVNHVP